MQQGYIRLYRCLLDKGWSRNPDYVAVWLYCLLRANYKPQEVFIDGKSVILLEGQFLTSRKQISINTGVHESKIQRILSCFESEQQIEQQTKSKYRVISIVNWHRYQAREQQNEQQMNGKRTTDEQQMNTDKERKKEIKEDKTPSSSYDDAFVSFWEKYPRKVGKGDAEKAWRKIKRPLETLTDILEALNWQRTSDQWTKNNGSYIPHPATYLNQRRWEDEPEASPLPIYTALRGVK